jgi:hypothetical protein
MNYYAPCYNDLGRIGESMNPMQNPFPPVHLTSQAIAEGPTIVMGIPDAGHFEIKHAGLDGRHFDRHYFENQSMQMRGWRDAVDVIAAIDFLFPIR